MKYRKIMLAALVFVVLVSGGASMGSPVLAQTAQPEQPSAEGESGVSTPDGNTPDNMPAIGPHDYDFAAHGTAWVPQRKAKFKWNPYGWGTAAKKKVVGDEWVHVSIPAATRIDGSRTKVNHVQFCAKSSAVGTKPVTMDIWDNKKKIASVPIVGWNDTGYHCAWKAFSPTIQFQSLGVSVKLHYAHALDEITLYKAFARVTP